MINDIRVGGLNYISNELEVKIEKDADEDVYDDETVITDLNDTDEENDADANNKRKRKKRKLNKYPEYKVIFPGPRYGLVLTDYKECIVVHQRTKERIADVGKYMKPHVGDILVSINSFKIDESTSFDDVFALLKREIDIKYVELTFVENKVFTESYMKEGRFKTENHHLSCEIDMVPNKST